MSKNGSKNRGIDQTDSGIKLKESEPLSGEPYVPVEIPKSASGKPQKRRLKIPKGNKGKVSRMPEAHESAPTITSQNDINIGSDPSLHIVLEPLKDREGDENATLESFVAGFPSIPKTMIFGEGKSKDGEKVSEANKAAQVNDENDAAKTQALEDITAPGSAGKTIPVPLPGLRLNSQPGQSQAQVQPFSPQNNGRKVQQVGQVQQGQSFSRQGTNQGQSLPNASGAVPMNRNPRNSGSIKSASNNSFRNATNQMRSGGSIPLNSPRAHAVNGFKQRGASANRLQMPRPGNVAPSGIPQTPFRPSVSAPLPWQVPMPGYMHVGNASNERFAGYKNMGQNRQSTQFGQTPNRYGQGFFTNSFSPYPGAGRVPQTGGMGRGVTQPVSQLRQTTPQMQTPQMQQPQTQYQLGSGTTGSGTTGSGMSVPQASGANSSYHQGSQTNNLGSSSSNQQHDVEDFTIFDKPPVPISVGMKTADSNHKKRRKVLIVVVLVILIAAAVAVGFLINTGRLNIPGVNISGNTSSGDNNVLVESNTNADNTSNTNTSTGPSTSNGGRGSVVYQYTAQTTKGITFSVEETATFDEEGNCATTVMKMRFPSEESAREYADSLSRDYGSNITIDSQEGPNVTVTINNSNLHLNREEYENALRYSVDDLIILKK